MHKGTFIQDEVTDFLPGSPATSSRAAALGSVIPFPIPSRVTAALDGLEGEASFPLDEDVFALGELAVRLVTQWNDVRVTCYKWAELWRGGNLSFGPARWGVPDNSISLVNGCLCARFFAFILGDRPEPQHHQNAGE